MPHYYPIVIQSGRSLSGDSLGFHAYSLRIDNLTNQWLIEETSMAWIPPYSLGVCLRLYGTGVAIILNQAPAGQPQPTALFGEQTIGVYSDQLRTEVAPTPVRQFSTVQSVSDLTQGPQPAFPPAGVTRLYADGQGLVHYVLSSGADRTLIDTSNYTTYVDPRITALVPGMINATALGADLWGTVSAGHVAIRYGNEIDMYDSGGTAHRFITASTTETWIQNALGGIIRFVNQAGSVELGRFDNTGNLFVTGLATPTAGLSTPGYVAAGPLIYGGAGDIGANRGNGSGYVFLSDITHYVGYAGTNYQMPNAGLVLGGDLNCSSCRVSGGMFIPWGQYLYYGGTTNTGLYMDQNLSEINFGTTFRWYRPVAGLSADMTIVSLSNGAAALQFSSGGSCAVGQGFVVGGVNLNGQSFFSAGGAGGPTGWQIISSERFKGSVTVIDDALQIVLNPSLHGSHYTKDIPSDVLYGGAIPDDNKQPLFDPQPEYGFIAEQWSIVAPDVVTFNDEGKAHMMDYGQVNAILFEAFKQYVAQTDQRLELLEQRPGPPPL